MLVDNDVYINKYVADGSTTEFPIAFPFLEASHIEVYTRGEDGEDILVDPSTYTITGAGVEAGGELTFNTAPVTGTVIAIIRNVPITQLYAYTELDNFPAESHEDALAKLTMIDQQQAEILGRAVLVPVTADETPEQLTEEIFQARDDASGYALDAAAYASSANNTLSSVISAGSAYVGQITSDGNSYLAQISSGGSASLSDISSAGNSYLTQISSGGSAQIVSIGSAGSSYLNQVSSGGSAQIVSIGSAGDTVLANISSGGSAAVNSVTSEGNTQVARLEQYASGVIQNATSLYKVATITLSSNIASGSTITTPLVNGAALSYWVGKDVLGLSYNGVELYKNLQYEEIGDPNTVSYQIKTLMPMYAGDQLSFKIMTALVDSIVADPLQPDGTSIQIDSNGKLSVVLTDQAITQAIGYTAANDSAVVKLTGSQTIRGEKTYNDNTYTHKALIFHSDGSGIQQNVNSAFVRVLGGAGQNNGAGLWVMGKDDTGLPGGFRMRANNGSMSKDFQGKPDGTLTWNGLGFVYDNGNQSIGGSKKFANSVIFDCAESHIADPIIVYRSEASENRCAVLRANNQSGYNELMIGACDENNSAPRGVFVRNTSGAVTFRPDSDNSISLGEIIARWTAVYAVNGTIQTSDERQKTDIAKIPDTALDAWGTLDWKQFRLRSAVEKKGEKARFHTGMIAQRIDEAFKEHGLEARDYGFFCYDEWDAEQAIVNDKGEVERPAVEAGNAYSLRYDEALVMEAAYQRRRADRAEARISALEQRLNELENVLITLGERNNG